MANETVPNTEQSDNSSTGSTVASDNTNSITATSNQTGSSDTNQLSVPTTGTVSDASTGSENKTSATTAEGDAGADANKKTPWFQRRIDQLTAEKWEERRAAEVLRKQTADLLEQLADARKSSSQQAVRTSSSEATDSGQTGQGQQPARSEPARQEYRQQLSEAEINALAEQRAEQIARERSFNKACNDVAAAGKEEYSDFDQTLRTFQMLGGLPPQFLETLTEMPNAHKILYAIGKDPDLAERVVKMSPTRQAMELARLEANLEKKSSRQVSAAPPPVRTIDTNARASENPETMSMQDFIKFREKQLSQRRK